MSILVLLFVLALGVEAIAAEAPISDALVPEPATPEQPSPNTEPLVPGLPPAEPPAPLEPSYILGGDLWPTQAADLAIDDARASARLRYARAVRAWQRGDMGEYRGLYDSLNGYPLQPYLRYQEYRARLGSITAVQINAFVADHPDLPLAARLQEAWLHRLGTSNRWQALIDNYPERPIADVELQCLWLRALLATGRRDEALDAVEPLWVVAHSQPRACDPLFETWLRTPRRTQDVVWRRLMLAVDANQRVLARYLQRFFEGQYRTWATALYDVHVSPQRILDRGRFAADTDLSRAVITHGLRRLAASDAQAAIDAFAQYRTTHAFEPAAARHLEQSLLVANAQQGRFPDPVPEGLEPSTLTAIGEAAVKRADWPQAGAWIGRMPADERGRDQWQYWSVRAAGETHAVPDEISSRYASVARDRSYYGFLAALRGGHPEALNAVHARIDSVAMVTFRARPEVARTEELIALQDRTNVRREWLALTSRLNQDDGVLWTYLLGARHEAALAISTANLFDLRDHVAVRFPVLYRTAFDDAARATGIPAARLMAMARQESAFDAAAVSSANARGLIQMLHSTAVLAARRADLSAPSLSDLANPEINIRLASRHLAWLMRRYDGVFPFAAAAYNAGEHRVDRWIVGARGMPMDVWIENIPYGETRNYVKNVLAFNQVYALLLNQPTPMLSRHELTVP